LFSARAFKAFFNFSSTQFSRAMTPVTLEEAARILCEPDTRYSEFERAILLFGLQVAAISPTVPRLAFDARLHAAMKILEHLEKTQGSPDGMSLTHRLALADYEKIVGQMLTRDGSWGAIARAWTRKELADDIKVRWDEARDVGRLVDFSYRFGQLRKGDPRKAGVTMARPFVCATTKISDGTMKARWREYGSTAVLAYLLQKIGPRPARLTTKKFVEKLLSQAADVERLRCLFAAYRDLSKLLRPRGYRCDPVEIGGLPKVAPTLGLKDFSSKELKVITSYKP
jgi:hypothetical protein